MKMKNPILYLTVFTLLSSVILLNFSWEADDATPEKDNKLFEKFVEQFPSDNLPYEINADKYSLTVDKEEAKDENEKNTRISHEFRVFIPGLMRASFSRRPPPQYKYENKLYENEAFVMVIYSITPSFSSLMNKPNEYVLATYKKGIDIESHKRMITAVTLSEKNKYLRLGKVNEDLTIEIKSYSTDLNSDDGKGKLYSTKKYAIAKTGTITKTNTDVHVKKSKKKNQAAKKANRAK